MVTSRYAELVTPGKFVIKEETLEPKANQLLIRITHCGLCQYDISYFKGIVGKTPMSIGHEPVGVVETVGRNIKEFAPVVLRPLDQLHRYREAHHSSPSIRRGSTPRAGETLATTAWP